MNIRRAFLLFITFNFFHAVNAFALGDSMLAYGLGYQQLVPMNQASDFFKKNESTLEIQKSNGIIGCIYFHFSPEQKFSLYLQSGYHWHSAMKTDTVINSGSYVKSTYYRTIPIVAGFDYTVLRIGERFYLKLGAGISYDLQSRYVDVPGALETTHTSTSGFGYAVSVVPGWRGSSMEIMSHLGYAKKNGIDFKYIDFILPFDFGWFKKKK